MWRDLWQKLKRRQREHAEAVGNVILVDGIPDEPDTGNWDAICAQPSVEEFFATLFRDVAQAPLPALTDTTEEEDGETRVQKGWYGDSTFGAEVNVVTILESSMFDTRCRWETYGLPGMKVKWRYFLAYAGQLGHVAYRHDRLECDFDSKADEEKFAMVWQKTIRKAPRFAKNANFAAPPQNPD